MGQRGPIADPNRHIRGWKRRATGTEPVGLPPIGDEPPVSLSETARRRWDAAIRSLPTVGVTLTVGDSASLARWAVLAGRLDDVNKAIDQGRAEGADVDRLIRQWLRLLAVVDGLSRSFGMDPSSRRRLQLPVQESKVHCE